MFKFASYVNSRVPVRSAFSLHACTNCACKQNFPTSIHSFEILPFYKQKILRKLCSLLPLAPIIRLVKLHQRMCGGIVLSAHNGAAQDQRSAKPLCECVRVYIVHNLHPTPWSLFHNVALIHGALADRRLVLPDSLSLPLTVQP
jgi:hypothetical protein